MVGSSSNGIGQDAVGMDARFNFYQKQRETSCYATDVSYDQPIYFCIGFCPINKNICNFATNIRWPMSTQILSLTTSNHRSSCKRTNQMLKLRFWKLYLWIFLLYVSIYAVLDKKIYQLLMRSDIWAQEERTRKKSHCLGAVKKDLILGLIQLNQITWTFCSYFT